MTRRSPFHRPALARLLRRAHLGPLALAAALGGCAAAPDLPPLPQELPPTWRHAGATTGATAPADWWTAFNDRQLDALVAQALDDNLDIAQARARLRAARTVRQTASAPFLPQARVGTRDAVAADASSSYFQAGFDASWELGLFGRAESTQRLAQADLQLAQTALQAARVSVAAEVVRNYLELRGAQDRLTRLDGALELQRRQVALMEIRQRARLTSLADLEQARAALASATADAGEPRFAILQHAQRLALLLGRAEPDAAWLQSAPLPDLARPPAAATPADMLRTRPDVRMAEARVLQAAGELGVAEADLYPRLGLGGSIVAASNFANNFNRDRPSYNRSIVSFGPQIDIPLFDWGLRAAARDAQGELLGAALDAYRLAVLQGAADVEIALIALDQQRQRLDAEARAAAALARAEDGARRRAELKLGSEFETADFGARRQQAELTLAATRLARGLAYVALHKALGGAPAESAPGEAAAAPSAAGREG